jgi:hypothetical protein
MSDIFLFCVGAIAVIALTLSLACVAWWLYNAITEEE